MRLDELALPPGCQAVSVTVWQDGAVRPHHDAVAQEVPVALEYNGIAHAVMLASPTDLEDFALGFSLSEGIVDAPQQVYGIEVLTSAHGITLQLEIASGCVVRLKERRRQLSGRTGCGLCGTEQLAQAIRPAPALGASVPLAVNAISHGLAQLPARQTLQGLTGATHAAAWCDAQGQIQLLREDVGRHNALDKLIGALLRSPHAAHAAQGWIAVTSRASYEMAYKCAVAGVPVLAAVSGVTALAIQTAEQAGLTLIGYARGQRLSVYSQPQRLAPSTTT